MKIEAEINCPSEAKAGTAAGGGAGPQAKASPINNALLSFFRPSTAPITNTSSRPTTEDL